MFGKKSLSPKKTKPKIEKLNKSVSSTALTKSKSPDKRRKSLSSLPVADPESAWNVTPGKIVGNSWIATPYQNSLGTLLSSTPESGKKATLEKRRKSVGSLPVPTPQSGKKVLKKAASPESRSKGAFVKRRKSVGSLLIPTPPSGKKDIQKALDSNMSQVSPNLIIKQRKSAGNWSIATPRSAKKVMKTPKKSLVSLSNATPGSGKKSMPKKSTPKSFNEIKTEIENEDETSESENEDDFPNKFKIDPANVEKAINGVIKFTAENPKLKNQLFNEQFPLFLQVNSIKIPSTYSKIVRIPLKNSLLSPDSEICLIVPDVKGIKNKDHEQHLEHYEELLRNKGVNNIKKLMTFHEFRTEYETFELKSRLVELYDHFLVDGKISGKVVHKCGKIFYKKRKIPTPIKLQATKLKSQIEGALQKTSLYLHSKGDSFVVQFGSNQMETSKLVENVFSVLEGLEKLFPGGFVNVRNVNIYTFRGLTIPIYTSLKNPNKVQLLDKEEKRPKWSKTVKGELTTRLNTEVIVEPTGEITVVTGIDDKDSDKKEKVPVVKSLKPKRKRGKKRAVKEDGISEPVIKKKKEEEVRSGEPLVKQENSTERTQKQSKLQEKKEKPKKELLKLSGKLVGAVGNKVLKESEKKQLLKNLQEPKVEKTSRSHQKLTKNVAVVAKVLKESNGAATNKKQIKKLVVRRKEGI